MRFLRSAPGRERELRDLWRNCFPEDSPAYLDWVMTRKVAPERARGLEGEDGALLCALHLLPLRLKMRGKEMDWPFVSGAGTFPRFRKRGYMNDLLRLTFEEQREAGVDVMGLYPFSYEFYRRAGFGIASRREVFRVPVCPAPPSGWGYGTEPLTAAAMEEAYRAMAARMGTCALRDRNWCASRLEEWQVDGGGGIALSEGEERGYALYALEDGALRAEELVYSCGGMRSALLAHMQREGAQMGAEQVLFGLPEGEAPLGLEGCAEDFAMLRVLDAVRLCEGMSMPGVPNGAVRWRLRDGQCPWNDGVIALCVEDGVLHAQRAEGGAEMDWSAPGFASLLAGTGGGGELFPAQKTLVFEQY